MREARKGHLVRIERLLEKGIDINTRGDFGQTALFEAVFSSQVEAVRFLLERGADPRLVSNDGAGPLFFACVRGNPDIVGTLIDYGADVNEVRRTEFASGEVHLTTPLDVATHGKHEKIVQMLLAAGASRRT